MPVVTRQMKKTQDAILAELETSAKDAYEKIPCTVDEFCMEMNTYFKNIRDTSCDSNEESCAKKLKLLVDVFKFVKTNGQFMPHNFSFAKFAREMWFKGFQLIIEVEMKPYFTDTVKQQFASDVLSNYDALKPFIEDVKYAAYAIKPVAVVKLSGLLSLNYSAQMCRSISQQLNIVSLICTYNYFKFTHEEIKDAIDRSTGLFDKEQHNRKFGTQMRRLLKQKVF